VTPRRPALLIVLVCIAHMLTLMGVFAFPALLPTFLADWSLSNAQAGWISGIPLAANAISVSILVSLTDRIDARLIFGGGAVLAACSLAGFALFADGFWSALVFRALGGVGMAATYMPGLRVLVDRYRGDAQSRAVALYTASFSLGTALSFLVSGAVGGALGWQAAFWVSCAAAVVSAALILPLDAIVPQRPDNPGSVLDIRPVLRNRAAMAYVLAYAAHGWELFALRAWMVAFLVFSLTLQPGGEGWPAPTVLATLGAIVAMVCSIAGNEWAERYGRRRMVVIYMLSAASLAMVIGFLPGLPYPIVAVLILIYCGLVQLDSASLTAGAVQAAEPGRRGATLGVHSFIGFAGSAVAPLAVGIVLDATGGGHSIASWGTGFIAMGSVCLIAPLAFMLGRGRRA
jgi:MFS family permease